MKNVKEYLKKVSDCTKCKTPMEFIKVSLGQLPDEVKKMVIELKLSYQYVKCKKCGETGLHLM